MQISGGDNSLASIQPDLLKAKLILSVNAFSKMWSFGLIFFGVHLLIVGYLALKSGFIPKILGFLLLIAASSYIVVHVLHVFFPQLEQMTAILENILSLPMALGELAFGIWLIIKGNLRITFNSADGYFSIKCKSLLLFSFNFFVEDDPSILHLLYTQGLSVSSSRQILCSPLFIGLSSSRFLRSILYGPSCHY
jgi:hypothetical protein